ncbi:MULTISPECIES: Lcl C-terminal domain-containing protein [unclassified Agarivorans]|uniref:Lcl C-terminal domain-containing protein n=1 Tax=unclassified Agarivorans TaxID=2636026 RepID=UPI0026E3A2E8|nr:MULTISPECIES: DUF1566 domain-containing protein [unclassified Agarivorans]MDO6684057.1 DUF1566 domain-containing protein [Agarivorans sp. 3_MG-2023]MDO6714209.1 DUF1566 domain-containing protein [Agarivorans sp. 2_MG-2023]
MTFLKLNTDTQLSRNYCLGCLAIFTAYLLTPLPAHGASVCLASSPLTAPDSRFVDNNDQTVSDLDTNLMWARCTLGRTWDGSTCNGAAQTKSWNQAVEEGPNSTLAGYNDWRLPNIKELSYLIEYNCYSPAINETFFSSEQGISMPFWTATPDSYNASKAWFINFINGQVGLDKKDDDYGVRLVRGGL